MDFSLNEQQRSIQAMASKFAKDELKKVAAEVEEKDQPPSQQVMKKLAKQGLLGVNLHNKYGGSGLGHLEAVLVLEEIAKSSIASGFPVFESCFGPILAIEHFGPEEMRQRIIPQVCAGEIIVAVAMSEPDAGSALTDLKTKAVQQGNKWILSGTKRWCSGAGHADYYVVYCRMSDEVGAKGIGAVLVSKNQTGISFSEKKSLWVLEGFHLLIYSLMILLLVKKT